MDQTTSLEHTADRLDSNSLTAQVLRMHERDHTGSAKFCEHAECCQTAHQFSVKQRREQIA